jgi:hypothetical protein
MAVTPTQMFEPTELSATPGAKLYTVPQYSLATILMRARIRFTNTSATPVSVTAYNVPSAGTPGTGNTFLPATTIPASGYLDIDIPVMAYGDYIQAFASTAGVVVAHALDAIIFS